MTDASIWSPGTALVAAAFSHATTYAANTVGDRLIKEVFATDAPYNVPTDGVTSAVASLNVVDALNRLVILPAGSYKINADITLDGGPYYFLPGAKLIIDLGVTVTIRTQIIAGEYQIIQDANTLPIGYPIIANLKGLRFQPGYQSKVYAAWWGAKGDYILPTGYINGAATDNTQPFRQATASIYSQYELNGDPTVLIRRNASTVEIAAGDFKTTGRINCVIGTNLQGQGKYNTTVHGVHTDAAIISVESALFALVEGIRVNGDPTHTPKTGFMLGRNTTASAAVNTLRGCGCSGYFSVAGVYSVAAEEILFDDCEFVVIGGSPRAPVVIAQSDVYNVAGLIGSANTVIRIVNCNIEHFNPDGAVNTSVIEMYVGSATDDIIIENCFLGARGTNQYIRIVINQGITDCGKIIIRNTQGEDAIDVTKLTQGIIISRAAAQILYKLEFTGSLLCFHPDAIFLYCRDTVINALFIRAITIPARPMRLGYLFNPDIIYNGDIIDVQLVSNGFITYAGTKSILPVLRNTNLYQRCFINDGFNYCGNTGKYEAIGGAFVRIISEGQNKTIITKAGILPTREHVEVGDRIRHTDTAAGGIPGQYCTVAGQTNAVAATTVNVTNGSAAGILASATGLEVDFLVNITGSATNPFRILTMVGTAVTFDKNSDLTDVAVAVVGKVATWRNEAAIA